MNHTEYTKKYETQLKRDYPRIPFYKNFRELSGLGEELIALHVHFEEVEPLSNVNVIQHEGGKKKPMIPRLKIDQKTGVVRLDDQTSIEGIPLKVYEYKLGLRSPIEWVLDQHKPLRATASGLANYGKIFEKFNTPENEQKRYERISKPLLIDLIPRLANLSLKTLEMKDQIRKMSE